MTGLLSRSRAPFTALALCLAFWFLPQAAAADPLPKGANMLTGCSGLTFSNGILTGTCSTDPNLSPATPTQKSSLDLSSCASMSSPIFNSGGTLICAAPFDNWGNGGAVPRGQYLVSSSGQYCVAPSVSGTMLSARCLDANNHAVPTSLDLSGCVREATIRPIFNGNLRCAPKLFAGQQDVSEFMWKEGKCGVVFAGNQMGPPYETTTIACETIHGRHLCDYYVAAKAWLGSRKCEISAGLRNQAKAIQPQVLQIGCTLGKDPAFPGPFYYSCPTIALTDQCLNIVNHGEFGDCSPQGNKASHVYIPPRITVQQQFQNRNPHGNYENLLPSSGQKHDVCMDWANQHPHTAAVCGPNGPPRGCPCENL